MASTTVVDQLIVTLGLDPSNFKKGQKEAAKALVDAKDNTKKQGDEIGKALDDAGRKVVTFFLSFEAASKIAGWLTDLGAAAANLSLLSRRTGESVHELDLFSRAVKISGGSAEEAQGLVSSLTQEMNAAQSGGGLSPFLQTAQAIGIAWRNNDGTLRKATEVIKDFGAAAAQNGPQVGAMLLGRAGVSGGVADFLLRQKEEQAAIYEQAQRQSVLDDKRAKDADKLRQTWNEIKDAIDAVGIELATNLAPIIERLAKDFKEMLNSFREGGGITEAIKTLTDAFQPLADLIRVILRGWKELGGLAKELGNDEDSLIGKGIRGLGHGFVAFHDLVTGEDWNAGGAPAPAAATGDTRTRGLRNNNPGNLRLPGGAHDKDGFSIFGSLEEGERQALAQINRYAARGIKSVEGIVSTYAPRADHNDTDAYINNVAKKLGVDRGATLSPDMMAQLLAAMFRVESGPGAPGVAQISSVIGPQAGAQRFGNVGPTPTGVAVAGSAGGTTNITHIDKIDVHTQATDANGIATGIDAAVKRKNLAAQADAGQS